MSAGASSRQSWSTFRFPSDWTVRIFFLLRTGTGERIERRPGKSLRFQVRCVGSIRSWKTLSTGFKRDLVSLMCWSTTPAFTSDWSYWGSFYGPWVVCNFRFIELLDDCDAISSELRKNFDASGLLQLFSIEVGGKACFRVIHRHQVAVKGLKTLKTSSTRHSIFQL